MSNIEVKQIVESAPDTLKRTTLPAICFEPPYRNIHSTERDDLSTELLTLRVSLLNSLGTDNMSIHNLSAGTVLREAISTPKSRFDRAGIWIDNLPGFFRDFIIKSRRELYRHSHAWIDGIRNSISGGRIWEFGIVIEDASGHFDIVSVSMPWDNTNVPPYVRLTRPDFEPTQGQREILDKLSGDIEPKFVVASATESWWQEAQRVNRPALTSDDENDYFTDRIVKEWQVANPDVNLPTILKNATKIFGYKIDCKPTLYNVAIMPELYLTRNWLDTISPESSRDKDWQTSRWRPIDGVLINDSLYSSKVGEFGVHIVMDDQYDAVGVMFFKSLKRRVDYLNHMCYVIDFKSGRIGKTRVMDKFHSDSILSNDIQELKPQDFIIIREIFDGCLKRTGIDLTKLNGIENLDKDKNAILKVDETLKIVENMNIPVEV